MNGEPSGLPIGMAGKFRIFLLVFATVFVATLLFFSQTITDQLLERERKIVDKNQLAAGRYIRTAAGRPPD